MDCSLTPAPYFPNSHASLAPPPHSSLDSSLEVGFIVLMGRHRDKWNHCRNDVITGHHVSLSPSLSTSEAAVEPGNACVTEMIRFSI